MTRISKKKSERICQGDIFRDVEYLEKADEADGVITVQKIRFPLAIVLTQDCDLESDHGRPDATAATSDSGRLLSVLMAPLYNYEHFKCEQHLVLLGYKDMHHINSNGMKIVRKNLDQRYHYLEFPSESQLVSAAVLDFKHYFSVTVAYLQSVREGSFVCQVAELYREQISHRFAHFLSRIGLPDREELAKSEVQGHLPVQID